MHEKYIDRESDIIRNIANGNGFSLKFINKLIYRTQFGIKRNNEFKYNEVKIDNFQYLPGLFENLRFKLKKCNRYLIAPPSLLK